MKRRGKIVLLHFVGQMPLAGIAWQAVHYLAPLQKLGFETWYVEDHGANPYDPRISSVVMDCAYNLATCAPRWSGTALASGGPIGMRSTTSITGFPAKPCGRSTPRPTR